jgi:hypothetical protein
MPRRPNQKNSFIKGIVLLAALIIGFFFYQQSDELIAGLTGVLNEIEQPSEVAPFEEDRKKEITESLAGFWTYDSERSNTPSNPSIRDRIELIDNGIIWRVRTEEYRLPAGDTASLTRIEQAFLHPGFFAEENTQTVSCDVRVLKKVLIHNTDTCYKPVYSQQEDGWKQDTVWYPLDERTWYVRRDGDRLFLDGKIYRNYGDKPLDQFFPEGALDLVDDIAVERCPSKFTEKTFVRDRIVKSVSGMNGEQADSRAPEEIFDSYYVPFCMKPIIDELWWTYGRPYPEFNVELQIAPDGAVEKAGLQGYDPALGRHLREALVAEIKAWRFPSRGEPYTVSHAVTIESGDAAPAMQAAGGAGE